MRFGFVVLGVVFAAGLMLVPASDPLHAKVRILEYGKGGKVKGIKKADPKYSPGKSGSTKTAKEFAPANRFIRREVVVVNPPRGFEEAVRGMGFSVSEKIKLSGLSLNLYRIRTPKAMSVPKAKSVLKRKFRRLNVDANHTFDVAAVAQAGDDESLQLARRKSGPDGCGKGLKIGMIDGPIDLKHAALKGRKIRYRSFIGKSARKASAVHGTAIAALFVGGQPKARLGGLVPGADLKVANVLERDKAGNTIARASTIVQAIDWLAQQGVKVVNVSLTGANNQALRAAVIKARSKGLIMVAAAGNWGNDKIAAYPAAYSQVISVTAVGRKKTVYSQANKGPYIDFAAQGIRVWTAKPGRGGHYQNGTSLAAPVIAAHAAVEISRGTKANPNDVRKALRRLAVDLGQKGKDKVYGWGLIDRAPRCK